MTTPALDDANGWADFWRYQIGVNVVPAIYKLKVPIVEWTKDKRGNWQTQPIPEDLHNEWKSKNMFKDGLGIITGNVFHNHMVGSYLACLDTDNGLATKRISISKENTLVQQRKNALDRAHSYFYSPRPVKRKPATSTANNKDLKDRLDNNLAPKFELRCIGDLVYTGKHESGYYYEIAGQEKPISFSLDQVLEVEWKVVDICKEFGLKNTVDIPSYELFKEDFQVYEGDNRSRELKRAMGRLLGFFWGTMSLEEIKEMARDWENKHCRPPYPENTGIFERNWKQALGYADRNYEKHPVEQDLEDHKDRLKNELSEPEKKKSKKVAEALDYVLMSNNFATFEETDEILYHNHGVYLKGGEVVIRKTIEKMFEEEASINLCREILDHVRRCTYHKRAEFDANIKIINLSNKLYDIEKGESLEHTSDYLSLNQKPFPYGANTPPPRKFIKFLKEVVYPSDVWTVIQLMAYTFLRDNPFEIITILLGGGSNGKSVLFGVLTALHGIANVSNVSLKTIIERPFGLYDLVGKDCNLDAEMSSGIIEDTALLKKITGRQVIRVEQKNQKAFDARIYAKEWLSCNSLPVVATNDQNDAYYRRNVIVGFPNRFEEIEDKEKGIRKLDPDMITKLTTTEELSGIFNLLMFALRRILKNKRISINEKTIQERRQKYEMAANPIGMFLRIAIHQDSKETDATTKETAYLAYQKFCKHYKLAIISKTMLGKIMKLHIRDEKETVEGKTTRVWKGIKLTDDYLTVVPEQETLDASSIWGV